MKIKDRAEQFFKNKYGEHQKEFCKEDIKNAYIAGFEEFYSLKYKWNDVKKYLPNEEQVVLVKVAEFSNDPSLRFALAYFLKGYWHFYDEFYIDYNVSHWMYIPKD